MERERAGRANSRVWFPGGSVRAILVSIVPIRTPEVCLTSKILPADHALGRYDPKSDRIFFSISEFYRYDADTQRYAVFHEIGHWFRQKRVPLNMIRRGWKFGDLNEEEGFADVFAMYFLNRSGLRRLHFEYEKTIEKYMSGDEVAIQRFAERVLEKLKESEGKTCFDVRCAILPVGDL
jgi:hypothetical protein